MVAARYNLRIEQGARLYRRFYYKSAAGVPIDVTSLIARIGMRLKYSNDRNDVISIMDEMQGYITNGGTAGYYDLIMSAAETARLNWFTSGVWDMEICQFTTTATVGPGSFAVDVADTDSVGKITANIGTPFLSLTPATMAATITGGYTAAIRTTSVYAGWLGKAAVQILVTTGGATPKVSWYIKDYSGAWELMASGVSITAVGGPPIIKDVTLTLPGGAGTLDIRFTNATGNPIIGDYWIATIAPKIVQIASSENGQEGRYRVRSVNATGTVLQLNRYLPGTDNADDTTMVISDIAITESTVKRFIEGIIVVKQAAAKEYFDYT